MQPPPGNFAGSRSQERFGGEVQRLTLNPPNGGNWRTWTGYGLDQGLHEMIGTGNKKQQPVAPDLSGATGYCFHRNPCRQLDRSLLIKYWGNSPQREPEPPKVVGAEIPPAYRFRSSWVGGVSMIRLLGCEPRKFQSLLPGKILWWKSHVKQKRGKDSAPFPCSPAP